jgi:tRNA dimethylallyltransferase
MNLSQAHLVFVVGPTACGKSDFAVQLAETCRQPAPEIINCDSIQFFDGVEIGAAKPGRDLLARARHHLIGHVPLGGEYNAGDFRRDAIRVIDEGEARGVRSFLTVGGSGFYVQALEKGMYDVPPIREGEREALECEATESGLERLYQELQSRDPEAAEKIQPADRYRILRSLEILRSSTSGESLSAIRARFEASRPPSPFRVSKIGLFRPRDVLREIVTLRTRKMLDSGLVGEVAELREKGLASWPPLKSVGYKETQDYLDGRLGFGELESAIVTSTMQLAKRQMTWFKRDPEIHWFDAQSQSQDALTYVRRLLET